MSWGPVFKVSTEEQEQAIGRLAKELGQTKRERALVEHETETAIERMRGMVGKLYDLRSDQGKQAAIEALNQCIAAGGLERLKALALDLDSLNVKISKLEIRAREAGI